MSLLPPLTPAHGWLVMFPVCDSTMFVIMLKRGPEDTLLAGTNTEEVLPCGYMSLSVCLSVGGKILSV